MNNEIFAEKLPLVLNIKDLMSMLAIGRNTAYELVRSGQIPSIRIGRTYRIPRDTLLKYLAQAEKLPQ